MIHDGHDGHEEGGFGAINYVGQDDGGAMGHVPREGRGIFSLSSLGNNFARVSDNVPDRRDFDRCEQKVESIEKALERPAVGSTPSVPVTRWRDKSRPWPRSIR